MARKAATGTDGRSRNMRHASSPLLDVNAAIAGTLSDLAFIQTETARRYAYRRAAAAILAVEHSMADLLRPGGTLPKIPGIGPSSSRVIQEVLAAGESPSAEAKIDASGKRAEVERRRTLRKHFISRAEARRILEDPAYDLLPAEAYRGDFQMHSTWSDGANTVAELAAACAARGYTRAAITDHSHGLALAGGMSMPEAAAQRAEIDAVNAAAGGAFHLFQGVEANIGEDGTLDLTDEEAARFDLVLAAPHSLLRKGHDQTPRMLAAVANPRVRILAHPRGRQSSVRAGVHGDWDVIFAAAAARHVAVELDGDPSRQDLDHTMAARALAAGCLFAVDSDAHATTELWYAEIALAHARLAGIPPDRIVNCWPLDRLQAWMAG
ncbi:MAG: PHP domain-containing protein [Vicinamibacterales bacterium]